MRMDTGKLKSINASIIDACVSLFALWTLSSSCMAALGGNLYHALGLFAVLVSTTGVALYGLRRRFTAVGLSCKPEQLPPGPLLPGMHPGLWQFVFGAGVIVALFFRTQSFWLLWICIIDYYLLALFWLRKNKMELPRLVQRDETAWRQEAAIWALALLFLGVTLVANRPDTDDSHYHAMAADAADHPDQPLFSRDPLFLADKLPFLLPAYKVESWTTMASALSLLSGFSVTALLHFLLPGLAGILTVFAQARFLRQLAPNWWFWPLLALCFVLLAMGEGHRTWGNFGYVRLHQGKGIFVTLGAPLIIAYGLAFARSPGWGKFFLLAAAQIASLGMTSVALWAGPAIAFFSLCCGLPRFKDGIIRLPAGCLASIYPLLMGLYVKMESVRSVAMQTFLTRSNYRQWAHASGRIDEYAYEMVMDWTPLACFSLFTMLTAWTIAPSARARRFAIFYPLLFYVIFLNPLLIAPLADMIISPFLYWRIFWILPMPYFLALFLASPGAMERGWDTLLKLSGIFIVFAWLGGAFSAPAWSVPSLDLTAFFAPHTLVFAFVASVIFALLAWALPREGSCFRFPALAMAMALMLFYLLLPVHNVLSPQNKTRITMPQLRVDRFYALAAWMVEHARPQSILLATEPVALWLTIFHAHPTPLLSRTLWDQSLEAMLPAEDFQNRLLLRRYISGQAPNENPDVIGQGLARYNIDMVCLPRTIPYYDQAESLLNAADFQRVHQHEEFDIWARRHAASLRGLSQP